MVHLSEDPAQVITDGGASAGDVIDKYFCQTATKPRQQTNAKPRVANPQAKKDPEEKASIAKPNAHKFMIKSEQIYNLLPFWWLLTTKDNNRMSKNWK